MKKRIFIVAVLTTLLVSCGGNGEDHGVENWILAIMLILAALKKG